MLEVTAYDVLGTANTSANIIEQKMFQAKAASVLAQPIDEKIIDDCINEANKLVSDLMLYKHMTDGSWTDTIYRGGS